MDSRKHYFPVGITIVSLLWCTEVWSLETLGVVGPVVDAEPFYTRLVKSSLPQPDASLSASDMSRITRWSGFQPYDSGLKLAAFAPKLFFQDEADRLITPICLLANDASSFDWLKRVKSILQRESAICYLVKLDSPTDAQRLQQVVDGVPMIALDPTFVIEQFNVPGYPALISHSGVEQ